MRPAAVALLLAVLCACDGAAPDHEPASSSADRPDGTFHLLFLNQVEGFEEGVPCDPASRSPLASAAVLRDRLVAQGADAVTLVAIGNALFGRDDPRAMKALNTALLGRGDALIESFAAAGLDLWVPGPVEMALDAERVLAKCAEAGVPLLVSNRRPTQAQPPVEEHEDEILDYRIVQAGSLRVALLGMIGQPPKPDPELVDVNPGQAGRRSRLEVRSAVAAARELSAELRRDQGVHVVIVLSAMAQGVNLRLAEAEGVDMVVGSTGEAFPAGRVIIEGSAAMLSASDQGRQVGHMTLRVREGDLHFVDLSPLYTLPAEAAPLQAELDEMIAHFGTSDRTRLAQLAAPDKVEDFLLRYRKIDDAADFTASYGNYEGTALIHRPAEWQDVPPGHPVLEALGRQGAAIEAALELTRLRPVESSEGGTEVMPDVASCRECHARQVTFWEQTPHARAYTALTARGRGRDPACLTCHAAGFGETVGWLDPRRDAPYGPVTCFSCHRLSSAHSENRIQVLNPAHYVAEAKYMNCEGCHSVLRSPGFDRAGVLASVTCPPMEASEPALVFARERALETLAARAERGASGEQDEYLAGLALVGLGRADEGARRLLAASTTNVDDVRQVIASSTALDGAGRTADALTVVRAFLERNPGDPTVNLEHVRLLLEGRDAAQRDPRSALALMDLVLPDDPQEYGAEHLSFLLLKVDALTVLKREPQARELLQLLMRTARDDPGVARRAEEYGLTAR